jgi:hypothetical protein
LHSLLEQWQHAISVQQYHSKINIRNILQTYVLTTIISAILTHMAYKSQLALSSCEAHFALTNFKSGSWNPELQKTKCMLIVFIYVIQTITVLYVTNLKV